MNAKRIILTTLFATLLGLSVSSRADDIDIYSGLGAAGNTPNVLFVLDNAADFSSNASGFSTCPVTNPTTGAVTNTNLSLNGTVGGIEQCALYNVINTLPVNANGTAVVNVGFMVYNAGNIRDINNANCGGSSGGCLAAPLVAMTAANKTSMLNWITSWTTTGGAGVGYIKASGEATAATMQEAWAYYAGKTGLSGRNYSALPSLAGCQKNFVIFIGNSYSASGTPGDAPSSAATALSCSTSTAAYCAGASTTQQAQILNTVTTSCGSYTFPSSAHETKGFYGDEWSRFMNQTNLYSTPTGTQGINTYTVGVLGSACQAQYSGLLSNMAAYGGGKYFPTTDYNGLVIAILKILNEVQAVNSVFSSSSLPVSVNAQGTFLNQVYMGMFRPDAGALPRWPGNLKQYQFIINPTTGALQLGDSLGNAAISSSGTGFLSPNSISFWSCTDLTTTPYPNSYATSTLSASQITLLKANNQNCTDPLPGGFWANDSSSANAVAKGFDLPDGERVERGGTAQQIRQINATTNYTTSPTAPRNLYTWLGGSADLTVAANAFATSNTGLVATAFGSTLTANISTLTRAGGIATVTTTGNHGFSTGDSIAIANANPSNYNGTSTITVVNATQFTYPITEYPPTLAAGTYTATLSGTPVSVSSLTRSGNTVTVNTTAAHGLLVGNTVNIAGATPTTYNGSFTVTSVPNATSFTYTVNERPPTVAGSGTASSITKTTGAGCPCSTTVTINAWNAATPGVQRTLGSTTVTVSTNTNISANPNNYVVGNSVTMSGVVDSTGTSVPEYNGSFIITSVAGNSFTFTTTLTPATPATGTITASPSASSQTITSLTRTVSTAASPNTATATATVASTVGMVAGTTVVSIGGTPGANESAYIGNFTISNVTGSTFSFPVGVTPASPASGLAGATMTATRSSGLNAANLNDLINWVRGFDNMGDESSLCPPGSTPGVGNCPNPAVTIRPSVHGDVLHSRPTVINYGSFMVTITGTVDAGTVRTATASAADVTTIGSFGASPVVTFANGQACPVTIASATTFTYQNTSCGAAGGQVASVGSKVVVFYGDNGGVFHAVNGNQTANLTSGAVTVGPGDEIWGFIPKEFFLKLNRLRTNSPQLNLPSTPPGISPQPLPKDYFIDGATGIYQSIDGNGNTTKAILYLSMRRGGRFIYALDVTTPATPTVLWKVDNTGITNSSGAFTANAAYSELGQTWSQPKVARVTGYANPVLIFGAGYDTNEDSEPITTMDASGRGIYVLDALTGAVVWSATRSAGATSCTGSVNQASCQVAGMNYSIPADITLMDRDADGLIDRLYAADTGGNIWRVDFEPAGNATPNFWRVYQFAALGGFTGPCGTGPCNPTQRKFFYAPEVITATATHPYDAVIAGSGDREHPLYVSTSTQRYNRLFLIKDIYTGNDATGMTTPITMTGTLPLFDATTTPWDGSLNGYYITLAAGEKVVNAPLVAAGYVYMGTNQPAPSSTTSCTSNLGTAKGYQLSPFSGTYTSSAFVGGGLPPSPVAGIVNIIVGGVVKQVPFIIGGGGNPNCVGSDCGSALGGQKPPITVSTKRSRTYWYLERK